MKKLVHLADLHLGAKLRDRDRIAERIVLPRRFSSEATSNCVSAEPSMPEIWRRQSWPPHLKSPTWQWP